MAVNNSLVKKQKTGLTAYLTQDAVKNQINNVIGGKNGQRFISAIVSAVNTNPALQECSNPSILSAALLGESLNFSILLVYLLKRPRASKTNISQRFWGSQELLSVRSMSLQPVAAVTLRKSPWPCLQRSHRESWWPG